MQAVVTGDSRLLERHAQHLQACEYCAGLRETLATPEVAQRAFCGLIEGYERLQEESTLERAPRIRKPEPSRVSGFPTWRPLAAALGVGALAFFAGYFYQTLRTLKPVAVAYDHSSPPKIVVEVPDVKTNWQGVRENCAQQSGQKCHDRATANSTAASASHARR
jgi:hypothetical protein